MPSAREAQLRHAEYYRDLLHRADELYMQGNNDLERGLSLFDREWANIQLGQQWAADHYCDEARTAQICSDFAGAGFILGIRQTPRERIEWLKVGFSAAKSINDVLTLIAHLANLGSAYAAVGDLQNAIQLFEKQLEGARLVGDRLEEGHAWSHLGGVYYRQFEFGEARRSHEQALSIYQELNHKRGIGYELNNLGRALLATDAKAAESYLRKALTIFKEIGDTPSEGNALCNIGLVHFRLGNMDRARKYLKRSCAIYARIPDSTNMGRALWLLGQSYAEQGNLSKAIEYAVQAIENLERAGDVMVAMVKDDLSRWRQRHQTLAVTTLSRGHT